MPAELLERLLRRRDRTPAPVIEAAPVIAPEAEAGGSRLDAIRETIDLLEADLSAMIRGVEAAASVVHDGTRASAQALEAIRQGTDTLARQSDSARQDSGQLAAATEEMAASSCEISRQVNHASTLTGEVHHVASATGASLDSLKHSSNEIGNVVSLIAAIAKQTNLLALNAKIEAARAGVAGRGFAVVADEVKALSVETQKATDEIGRRVSELQRDAGAMIEAVNRITGMLEAIQPVFGAVAAAATEQNATATELARNAAVTSQFVTAVADGAAEIDRSALAASGQSDLVDRSSMTMLQLASELKTRAVIFLRQTEIGDRRKSDRVPSEIAVTVRHASGNWHGTTADLSDGGMMARFSPCPELPIGTQVDASLAGIGALKARIVNRAADCLHLAFFDIEDTVRPALANRIRTVKDESEPLIRTAIDGANRISAELERLFASGAITFEAIFDNNYVPIPGSDPAQYRTQFLDLMEQVLPSIQNPIRESHAGMTLCCTIDRNGYTPVHRPQHSLPQRPGDREWNERNCRNRRIYNDRARLAAARSTRPFIIQEFRHVRRGKPMLIRAIAAPIRVFGKHWGALRTSYSI